MKTQATEELQEDLSKLGLGKKNMANFKYILIGSELAEIERERFCTCA